MEVVQRIAAFGAATEGVRRRGAVVGLVPTMGALHAGHRSLVHRARAECGYVALTIFVNPLQFGDPDDIDHYPKTLEADLDVCAADGVDLVLAPPVGEMYRTWPVPPATRVSVAGVSAPWEGAGRPGHFDGVATVVAKLFAMTGRCRAYFGEKDFQQLAVVRRMVDDLSMPVDVVGCATVREPDGLALSSRNVRLSPEERSAAPALARALGAGVRVVAELVHATDRPVGATGQPDRARVQTDTRRTVGTVVAAMERVLKAEPLVDAEYAALVDARDLVAPAAVQDPGDLRLLVAARVGPVRLIDNCPAAGPAPA